MALAIANNVLNRINQIGNFRELSVGAGSSVFKMINPWVWGGGVNPAAATFKLYLPTGALTTTGTINATGGTITGSLLVGSATGTSVLIDGVNGNLQLKYDGTVTGTVDGYTTEGAETSYIRLVASSGRYIKLKNSYIEIDGSLLVDNAGHTAKVTAAGFDTISAPGDNGNSNFLTAIGYDGAQLRYKYRNLTFTNGVITDFGDESGWNNVS